MHEKPISLTRLTSMFKDYILYGLFSETLIEIMIPIIHIKAVRHTFKSDLVRPSRVIVIFIP
jgi:hypothetical protein